MIIQLCIVIVIILSVLVIIIILNTSFIVDSKFSIKTNKQQLTKKKLKYTNETYLY